MLDNSKEQFSVSVPHGVCVIISADLLGTLMVFNLTYAKNQPFISSNLS